VRSARPSTLAFVEKALAGKANVNHCNKVGGGAVQSLNSVAAHRSKPLETAQTAWFHFNL
jgi:hypothetical protein